MNKNDIHIVSSTQPELQTSLKKKRISHDSRLEGRKKCKRNAFIGLKKKKCRLFIGNLLVEGSGVNSLTWSRRLSELELRSK